MSVRWTGAIANVVPAGAMFKDVLVGAYVLLQCDGLMTWDDTFYRDYFKGIKLIVSRV